MEKLLLRIEEAALRLSISRAHLYRLMERGEISAVKLGRSVRIPEAELTSYVERLVGSAGR